MKHFFVPADQVTGKTFTILGNDVNHIRNVLRMKPGEELSVSNGRDGREYRCGIVAIEEDRVVCALRFIKEAAVELPSKVYLFQALPKADKMELIIQKTVELGVHEIIPVACARCVVKLDPAKARVKAGRWQSLAEAAAKQSGRGIVPKVAPVTTFPKALEYAAAMDVKLIPYELEEGMGRTKEALGSLNAGQTVAVFIGPEGGFEETEVKRARDVGSIPITLGKRILRTETAGLTLMAWIMYQLEE
ncbi:MAG: 16S rRNA (uracil(1498)-N(3))-methyltransferase [Clostridium sp.]|jgi:16S rRNA (uracil1498-N3)-methyltransferase|nr:16S rRNA (uracil(1498)-N(3))-methyltransferase [Clostridium sp.]